MTWQWWWYNLEFVLLICEFQRDRADHDGGDKTFFIGGVL